LSDRHFGIDQIQYTLENGVLKGIIKSVPLSVYDNVAITAEYLSLSVLLLLSLIIICHPQLHKSFTPPIPIVKLVFSSYLFVLAILRLLKHKGSLRFPTLWFHSTTIYFSSLILNSVLFRSVIIHPNKSGPWVFQIYAVEVSISLALVILTFSSNRGGQSHTIYYPVDGSEPSPESRASVFSLISYGWLNPLVWAASRSPLQKHDIWGLRYEDYALNVLKSFEQFKAFKSFPIRLFANFRVYFALQALWAIMESIMIFIPSLLLKIVLEYVEDPSKKSRSLAWTVVLLFPICKMAESVVESASMFLGRRICLRMKAVLIGQIYSKALRRKLTLTPKAKEDESVSIESSDSLDIDTDSTSKSAVMGEIINLMSIDAFKVSEICATLHFFVSSVFMMVICFYLLFRLIGWSAAVGSLVIILLFPVNTLLYAQQDRIQEKMFECTDNRIQKLHETFQAIKIIKFFAWENKFLENILKLREEELYQRRKRTNSWLVSCFVWFATPTVVLLVSFYHYVIIEQKILTVSIAFTALSLFSLINIPLEQLSDVVASIIQCKVSLYRIDRFLNEDETSKYSQLDHKRGPNSPEIGFENASFSWNATTENDFKLRDLSIDFKVGKLNVVIGPTGAGKTSLLLALLGEMTLTSGNVFLPGIIPRDELEVDPQTGLTESVAYCSQAAWLLNDTIKNNITFGSPLNEDRYKKVIEACGLTRDLEILSAGDATEVGEKGITLSGGQKQRVSLARALYSNSKHVLLDDCLSAVDSHTALWIYENCVSGPLMGGRTCILVSHNVALTVQNAAWIVSLDNGRIKNQGTPEALLETGDLGDDDLIKSSVISSRNASSSNLQSLEDKNADLKSKAAVIENKLKALSKTDDEDAANQKKHDGKLVEEEGKAEGVVDFSVYTGYAKYFGGFGMWFLIIFIFALSQGVYMIQSYWLRTWSINSENEVSILLQRAGSYMATSVFNPAQYSSVVHTYNSAVQFYTSSVDTMETFKKSHGSLYYIGVYGAIGLFYAITASLRVCLTYFAGIKASNQIFKDVLTRILKARLRFFDKTPLGRIMNRFSKDIEAVDQELTPFAEGTFICIVQCVSTLILITFITPGFLIFAFIVSFLYYLVGYFYISLSRELKRYESITKSPIHQHFSESLNGVATIRAYGIESRFMKQNIQAIDNNNRPFFYLWVANRWLSFRIDSVGSLVMLFAGIFVLLSVGKIDAGLAGLSLSYAIAFSESALWIVRLYANIEMNMNSFERLQEYLEVEQEAPYEIEETEPAVSWPESGRINVKDVSLRYAPELPRVIKNVSFDVEPNQKVGIVGRTGAGKSTIITALFRFLDPETGSIHIDGVDITKIGLKNLRQAITIIPQDPTLFAGTIRSNLDPFGQYSDFSMFEALRRVNLIGADELVTNENPVMASNSSDDENQNKFLNLDAPIAEGGGNLSQGERQLVCLARSLLKNPKVMLLDEATSSIDYKSDSMIQQTIRKEFSNSTILTIAHRLRTIIDYDKILVMDAGQVVEYDNPYVLIANKESLFYSMCENSGELDALVRLAKEAYVEKKNKKTNNLFA
jgi:ABC-type multidrug transport system fused ATPase/permease subunit